MRSRILSKATQFTVVMALAGCAAQPSQQANIDPKTGLVACQPRAGLLWTNGGNRPLNSPNSLPPGAKDGTSSCIAQNTAHPYAAQ